jgi:hypothetical protein
MYVGFVVDRVTLGQIFDRVLRYSSTTNTNQDSVIVIAARLLAGGSGVQIQAGKRFLSSFKNPEWL